MWQFVDPGLRDTLEQIDVSKLLIAKYPDVGPNEFSDVYVDQWSLS
jgi:hypothetical protein